MNLWPWMRRCLPALALLWLAGASAAFAVASDLSERLKQPDHVLLMRHAYAPGVGDPPGYSLQRCETQRVLNDEGM